MGSAARDDLWGHPDLLPTADDIDDPSRIIASIQAGPVDDDAFDQALSDLLAGEGDRPVEGAPGEEPTEGDDEGPVHN